MRLFARKQEPRRRTRLSNPGKKIHKDMKHIVPAIAVATVLTLGALGQRVSAGGRKTSRPSRCPICHRGADDKSKTKLGSNEIVKIEKKTEEGKTVYEAVVNKSGTEWSIEVDANGKFLKRTKRARKRKRKARNANRNEVDRAVPCSMLVRRQSRVSLTSLAERLIHL